MKHIKLFEQFIKESQEEDIAYDILQDLLGERDPEELEMMDLVDAEDTVMAYGHKGAKAKKIAKALVNLAQSGAFESKVIKESQVATNALVAMYNDEIGDEDIDSVASFVYDNYDKITGLRLKDRDEEMEFPSSVLAFVDAVMGKGWHKAGNNYDKFSQAYGEVAG